MGIFFIKEEEFDEKQINFIFYTDHFILEAFIWIKYKLNVKLNEISVLIYGAAFVPS